MGNHTRQLAAIVEHNTVRTGAATIVHVVVGQDGEFIVRPGDGEVEILVVVVLVRIVAGLAAGLVQGVALLDGGVDVAGSVADGAAGGCALAGDQDGGGRDIEEEEGGEGEELAERITQYGCHWSEAEQ